MDLHRTLLKDVILPKIKSVFVIDYYEGVRGLLESRSDFQYKDIFANPRIRTKTEIIWSTDAFKSHPRKLVDLYGEDKEYYSYLLCKEIEALASLIDTLKIEDGGMPLSELLSRTVSNIDEKSVYCGDDKIVIVNWGLIPRQAAFEGSGIYRSGKFIGGWDKAHQINPKQPMQNYSLDETIAEAIESTDERVNTDDFENSLESKSIEEEKTSDSNTLIEPTETLEDMASNTEVESNTDDETVDETDNENETDNREITPDKPETVTVEEPKTEEIEAVVPERKSESNIKPNPQYGWKQLFANLWEGIKFLIKKLWWILLLILLILASLFGFRNCQGPISEYNPFYCPLPEKSTIMPIEKNGVSISEDGMYKVASDRLNIMLEKEDDNTMLDWAKAFKKAYPSSDYEIKYYNEDTYVLQIKVPSDQRVKVKKELNSKLSDFGFDVFEETVFQADFTSNDPALTDPKASWYLSPIGAKEAWDMTQGDEDVIVAVVDNGFDLNHPELQGKIVNPYNVLSQDDNIRPIVTSKGVNAHGTHVAATAVGNGNNGNGLLGIAPNCKLMPIQVGNDNLDGSMSNTAILEGVLYAINKGADVVNVSLGMYTPDEVKGMSEGQQLNYIANSFKPEETMWEKVFQKAQEKDCIIVFAAGNDNVISGIDPKKRNTNTLRVSAVAPNETKAGFSNFGRYPNLHRDYSTVSAPGVAIYSAAPNDQYQYMQGTSMAAPIVTGTIALMKSANHNLSSEEAITILQETGKAIDSSIGPMINIAQAVRVAMGDTPNIDCEKIREEVQRLQAKIDSLSQICPGSVEPSDTLKYNDVIDDPRSLDGTWKSTTELVNNTDQSPIVLYMTFKNLKGQLTIVNKDLSFTAPLQASVEDKKIHITQSGPAINANTNTSFVPYTYACSADRKGNLFCDAVSATNRVSFNLIRIR